MFRLLALTVLALICVVARPSTVFAQFPLRQPGEPPQEEEGSGVPLPGATPRAARLRGPVPCDEIVAHIDHERAVQKGGAVNLAVMARELGTTAPWTARCLLAYGRRVPRSSETFQDEDQLEKFEEQEPEETAPEDVEEPGAHERDEVADENSRDRRELHVDNPLKPAPEKERLLREHPESPEEEGTGGYEGYSGGYEGFSQGYKSGGD